MNRIPLVSVIVPVYNVMNYLELCVESIINQSYSNLEIILVDDGSTDISGEICDSYANKDKRIKVIHKENGGLSDARNAGLDIMTGEYVTCIDSDDFVLKYYIENLLNAILFSDSEVSCSWFVEYYDGDRIPNSEEYRSNVDVVDKQEFFKRLLYQNRVEVAAWGKMYKSDLFDGIRYPKGKLYEDMATTYRLIEKAKTIAIIPCIDYCYLQRDNSIAKSTFSLKKMDAVEHVGKLKAFIEEKYPMLESAAKCRYFSVICNIIFLIDDGSFVDQKKHLWNEIKKYRRIVLRDKYVNKKSKVAALISYLGFNALKFVYTKSKRRIAK